MNIYSLDINTTQMPTARTTRKFTINGDKNAEFEVIVLQNPSSSSNHTLYYDFRDRSFSAGHNDLHNNLKVKLTSSTYFNDIIFPSGGGDYVVKLIPTNGTEIFNSNSNIITKSISKQSANATLTFKPGSADTSYYQTLPTATSTGAINDTATVNFSFDVDNSTTDAKSYGFKITDATIPHYDLDYWYYETTEAVVTNGSGTDGADTLTVTVADTSEIVAGMDLKYYKGTTTPELNDGSSAGNIRISNVNTDTGVITFTSEVGFDEGQTMTFRAYGRVIQSSIDATIYFGESTLETTTLTKTVEARDGVTEATDGSSTSIALPNTLGIGGGNNFSYTGVGVNNSSSNNVTSVTADGDGSGNDGLIVVQLAQNLTAGTVLTFKETHAEVTITGSIMISKYPSANKTIYFDLDKVLTVGAAS
jgi:hypothetical protein